MEQIEEFDFLNSKFFMATDRMFKYFVIFGLFALLIILSVYPVENPDIWAHLKVGEQILETGKLVQSSVF